MLEATVEIGDVVFNVEYEHQPYEPRTEFFPGVREDVFVHKVEIIEGTLLDVLTKSIDLENIEECLFAIHEKH